MKVYFLIISLMTFINLYSQNANSSGLSFLKLGFGARNLALGDAGNAISNDLTALYYNPSKLVYTKNNEVMFMHNSWIQGVDGAMLGVKTFLFGLPFAIGLNTTNISDIEVRKIPGEPITKFDANYFYGSLSTAFKVQELFSVGATIRYIYEGYLSDESTGFGFDIGLNYKLPLEGFYLSAALRNLGKMNKLRNEATKLPSEFRMGVSYYHNLDNNKLGIVLAGEYQKYFKSYYHLNFGFETVYDKIIAFRAGYQSNYEIRGLTAGIGLMWGNLKFDYSFIPFLLSMGSANLFSVGFNF